MPTAVAAATPDLRAGSEVVSTVELKGVPLGTSGKVIHVQGLSWIRYWVRFDNGLRVGTLHRTKLATPAEWERRHDVVEVAPAATAASGATAVAAVESVGGVPGHLLERSRKARERLAAKA